MSAQHPSPRRRRVLRALGGLFIVVALAATALVLQQRGQDQTAAVDEPDQVAEGSAGAAAGTEAAEGAAHGNQAAEAGEAGADEATSADSDSVAADSTAAKAPKKGGLFAFLRIPGNDKDKKEEEKEPGVPVETASVSRRDIPSFFVGTATVEAEQKAQVLAKIAGTVHEILVEEGDEIQEGQTLLQIDDAEERARLEEARVRAASTQREYERTMSLVEKDLASERELEDKKLLAEEARAKLMVGEIQLGHTKVAAPFSGRVTLRHVHVGEHVQVNQALFDIADFSPLLVRVFMPERQVARIAEGQPVRVFPDADDDKSYPGRVRMIAPVVDTRSGTVKVTVELDASPQDLRLGSFVRVRITTDVHEDALVIPKVALVEDGGESFVFRAEADSVLKVRVETGYTDTEFAEVLVGLRDGDRVVTAGQGGLKHGARVRDLNEQKTADADSTQSKTAEGDNEVARK